MNDLIQNFISSRFPITGLAAYNVYRSDTVIDSQCLSKSLYASSADQLLGRFVKRGRALLPSGKQPAHYCWTFEAHQIYVAARADGHSLALLVENNISVQRASIRDILQGFLDIREE